MSITQFGFTERRITDSQYNHVLTNTHVWSHDGQWIYYDVRSADDCFDGHRIERVHARTSEIQVVFEARDGACVGVVTASPSDDRIAFIHGPENPREDWQYAAYHRRGVIMSPHDQATARNLDARDVVPPFTMGALRGGTHVHVFSPDGQAISFTYEDHVLAVSRSSHAQRNQRNVGISMPYGRVEVPRIHQRNHDGIWFSFLATRTHDDPIPGSDQISKAYEDAWVKRPSQGSKGSFSQRSLAFIGDVVSLEGNVVPELFTLQLPGDCRVSGDGPLQGTASTRPCPPLGTMQRRLTFTTDRPFPGLAVDVRHWPRSSPDGSQIALLMRDTAGIVQLWLVSPSGESPRQLTFGSEGINSSFTYRGDGLGIACVIGRAVCEVNPKTGEVHRLTDSEDERRVLPTAVVYSPDGSEIAFAKMVYEQGTATSQLFTVSTR